MRFTPMAVLGPLLVLACRDRTPAPSVPPRPPAQAPAAQVDLAPLCGGRPGCRLVESLPAGKTAQGETLTVHKLALPRDAERDCEPFEYWLATTRGPELRTRRDLLHACNDGYGAAGVGEDVVEVKAGTFHHLRHGGSAWRWTTRTTLGLDPLRVLERGTESSWTLGTTRSDESVRYDELRGTVQWWTPPCSDESADGQYVFDAIPLVTVEGDLASGAVDLGRCALAVDGSPGRGYTVHGAAQPESASFRVLMVAPRTLVVQVTDDLVISDAPSWLFDDHLELWLSNADAHLERAQGACLEPLPPPVQWAIRSADGAVFAAHGKPTNPPAVTRTAQENRVTFTVTLPPDATRLTVVYSDSDDGAHQTRLIATSRLAFARTATLGAVREVPASELRCRVEGGVLVPHAVQTFPADAPVLGD